jgi:hypothetical protein
MSKQGMSKPGMSKPGMSKPGAPEPFVIAAPEPRRPSGRAILFAGVAGACVLGVGLGLWARPGLHERQAALVERAAAPAPAAAHQLEIVVDDRPHPIGAPLEVLSPGAAPTAPPPLAPTRPPQGLIRTSDAPAEAAVERQAPQSSGPASLRALLPGVASALAAARLTLARFEHSAPAAIEHVEAAARDRKAELARARAHELAVAQADAARAEAHRAALAKAAFEKAEADAAEAKAEAAEKAAEDAHKVQLAKAAAKAQAHRVAVARLEAQKAASAKAEAARVQLARAEAAKAAAHRLELARQAQAAKAEKVEKVRLAKAEARARAAQREEARLEALAAAAETRQKALLARLARAKHPPAVELAKADRRHGARFHEVQAVSVKARRRAEPPRLAVPAYPHHVRPEPVAPQQADGLMKVSTSPRCASRDPGQALVCADPSLSAADRQMARAYQGARAAGVPDGELQRGQQRWLAARSAAAREAPWAVRDVYMARIAELNGQAKEAQGGY